MRLTDNLARVPDIKQHHTEEHEACIKNIQIVLVAQQDTVLTHAVFGNTEHGSGENQSAGRVQHHQEPLPWNGEGLRALGREAKDPVVEDARRHDEDLKEEYLDPEAAHDDVLAQVDVGLGFGLREHATAWVEKLACERRSEAVMREKQRKGD